VPDFYQGMETFEFLLVDPDNRRPVDFESRRALLADLEGKDPAQLFSDPEDSRAKLHVMRAALAFRKWRRDLLERGEYLPLQATGPHAARVCAFVRRLDNRATAVACGRFFTRGGWPGTKLPLPPPSPGAPCARC